jgi:hypothetical protein
MDISAIDAIAREVCKLFQEQIDFIKRRGFDNLTRVEREAYQARRQRILQLRSELSS